MIRYGVCKGYKIRGRENPSDPRTKEFELQCRPSLTLSRFLSR